jgi:hypothetical protein
VPGVPATSPDRRDPGRFPCARLSASPLHRCGRGVISISCSGTRLTPAACRLRQQRRDHQQQVPALGDVDTDRMVTALIDGMPAPVQRAQSPLDRLHHMRVENWKYGLAARSWAQDLQGQERSRDADSHHPQRHPPWKPASVPCPDRSPGCVAAWSLASLVTRRRVR